MDQFEYKSINGEIRDPFGNRMYLSSAEVHGHLYKRLLDVYGTGGIAILYQMGLDYGSTRVEVLKRNLPSDPDTIVEALIQFIVSGGWGTMRINKQTSDPFLISVTVEKSVFAEGILKAIGKQVIPTCLFLNGALVGAFQVLYNKPLVAKEAICLARGDPHCDFEITEDSQG